jgi:trigger factor
LPAPDQATCKRELVIEVPADVVREEAEKVARSLQRKARVPGFRPGKTPLDLVKQRFREEIREEVIHNLAPEHFRRRAAQEKLNPVESPDIADVHLNLEANEPLTFKAVFEVLPEFELKDHLGLEVNVSEPSVTDQDVEAELKKLQEEQATFEVVEDRALEDGDFASISFEGRPAPGGERRDASQPPGRPVKLNEVLCEIGGANTVPAFTENLRGALPEEERTFTVSYPADFDNRQLAGQTLLYKVKVHGIKRRRVPELNDDFARDLGGELTSMEQVRARIREQLEQTRRRQAEQQAKEKLVDRLIQMHDFSVPEALVEDRLRTRMERTVRQLASQGVDPAKVNVDWSKVRETQRQAAVRDVKADLLLDRIAEKEGIEVTQDEINSETEQLVRQVNPRDAAAVRERLTRPRAAEGIKHRLRSDKALDLVYRQANRSVSPARTESLS